MKVQSLAGEDPLEEEMATHSSSLGWKIQWTEEPGLYSPSGCKESATAEHMAHDSTGLTAVKDGALQERVREGSSVGVADGLPTRSPASLHSLFSSLNVGWTYRSISNEENRSEVMGCHPWTSLEKL